MSVILWGAPDAIQGVYVVAKTGTGGQPNNPQGVQRFSQGDTSRKKGGQKSADMAYFRPVLGGKSIHFFGQMGPGALRYITGENSIPDFIY